MNIENIQQRINKLWKNHIMTQGSVPDYIIVDDPLFRAVQIFDKIKELKELYTKLNDPQRRVEVRRERRQLTAWRNYQYTEHTVTANALQGVPPVNDINVKAWRQRRLKRKLPTIYTTDKRGILHATKSRPWRENKQRTI